MPCSSSQKLCNAGERECDTGQPMIPASLVRPAILIGAPSSKRSRSGRQQAPFAQKTKKFHERQAQYCKIIAADPGKQLNPATFQAIGADREEQRVTLGGDIHVEE